MNTRNAAPSRRLAGPPDVDVVWTLAQKELRDALRNRWFLLYTLTFVALALGLAYLAMAGAGMVGFAGFGRTAASLINLVLLIVPLMALTIGAQSLAGESERGTLTYILALPISRIEVFLGKYLGLALSLLASITMGFGIAAMVMAVTGIGGVDSGAYVRLVALAVMLSLAMLSIGMLVSVLTRMASVAVGIGLFLWLAFVFLGDLGLMGTTVALRVPVDALLWASLANPLQVFKLAAVLNIRASVDVLGPAGMYAMQQYGGFLVAILLAVLIGWIVLPAGLAYARFVTRGDL